MSWPCVITIPSKGYYTGLVLDHQICIAHVRKRVRRGTDQLISEAEGEGDTQKFIDDCERVRQLVKDFPLAGILR